MIPDCSQEPTIYPCSETSKFNHLPILVLRESVTLILSIHIQLWFPSGLFHCRLFDEKSVHICLLACYIPTRIILPRFHYPKGMRSEARIMKLLITKSSYSFYYFLLGPNTYLDRFVGGRCSRPNRTKMR